MRPDAFQDVEAAIYDAAFDGKLWPSVLQLITRATRAVGAAMIVRDSSSDFVYHAKFVGPFADASAAYIEHYAKVDPFASVLRSRSPDQLIRMSDGVSVSGLRSNEWYNDYILKYGVGDLVGGRVSKSADCTVAFGIHEEIGQRPLPPRPTMQLSRLLRPLSRAIDLQRRIHEHGWRSSVAARSLDQLSTAVIVSDAQGKIVDVNRIAEEMIRQGDGLLARHGMLRTSRAFESAKLLAALSSAAAATDRSAIRRMPVGRPSGGSPYLLTVAPLAAHIAAYGRPLVLTLIIDPDARRLSHGLVTELFGLSPSESRLAVALVSGRTLRDIAHDLTLEVATLRTQLRSIFQKVGVNRQVDLMRILMSIPTGPGGW